MEIFVVVSDNAQNMLEELTHPIGSTGLMHMRGPRFGAMGGMAYKNAPIWLRAPLKSVRYIPFEQENQTIGGVSFPNLLEQVPEGINHLYTRGHVKFGGQMSCHFRNGVWQIQFKESLC